MTGGSRTTFYRDNHNEDNKKYNRKTIAIIIFVAALSAAKLYFLWFWPWRKTTTLSKKRCERGKEVCVSVPGNVSISLL
jgi:hypothetical protein